MDHDTLRSPKGHFLFKQNKAKEKVLEGLEDSGSEDLPPTWGQAAGRGPVGS